MKKTEVKKLVLAGILLPLSIPVGASKCFPVQHMVNVLAAVFLGSWYGVGMAFVTSLLRVSLGTGSLLAFPGSMCGALLCGLAYKYSRRLWATYVGEVLGTAIIGGLAAYPVATMGMGKTAALFAYVIPFGVSTVGGTILNAIFIADLQRTKALKGLASSKG